MKARELIERLQAIPEDTEITVWLDGERYEISIIDPVDFWDAEIPVADINLAGKDEQIQSISR